MPGTKLAEEFDAIIIGSGFGGGVSACRLAEAKRSVAVLERGKRYPPGSFGRSPREFAASFWDPSRGLHGMFDLWSFRGLEALVSSGLGGGSLIYANVLLRKPEKWFVREQPHEGGYEYWPVTREDLDPCYDKAEQMLGARPYPLDHAPYDRTAKTLAMQSAGRRHGIEWHLPNLAVSFGEPHPVPGIPVGRPGDNLHNAQRYACRLCGECDIGCNYGSKNTVDHTYLSVAARAGARIEDRCEVRRIEWRDGRWSVTFVRHRAEHEGARTDTRHLPTETWGAKVVVVSAGALGSTYLLLKNRSAIPHISSQLGTRFCGNGDVLGFVTGGRSRVFDPSRGPVITSTLKVPDALDGGAGRGLYVQDGGYPEFLGWMLEAAHPMGPLRRAVSFAARRVWSALTHQPRSELSGQLAAILGATRASAGTLPMLAMGRDVPDGRIRLRRGYLDVDWTTATSEAYYARVIATMRNVAEALDSHLKLNPTWLLRRVITVHPVGGCPMGRDEREGVVDNHGEVFGYPGLFVADGSVMPGPVGPNPSLTIAALAERFSGRMIERSAP